MAVYDEVQGQGRSIIGNLVLIFVVGILFFWGFLYLHVQPPVLLEKHAVMSNYDFIKHNCRPQDFFAAASDGNGSRVEFCKTTTGQIGIIISRGRSIEVHIIEGDFTQLDMQRFIESLGQEWKLDWFHGGIIDYVPRK